MSGSRANRWLPVLAAFVLMALAPPAHAMLLVATPAVHTATVRRLGAHHRHHARRHQARAQLTRREQGTRPALPAAPAPSPARSPHRAALPRTTITQQNERRHAPGPRWAQAAPTASALDPVMTMAGRLELGRPAASTSREGRVTSGRGPPRAPGAASLPPSSARPRHTLGSAADGASSAVSAPAAYRTVTDPGVSLFGPSFPAASEPVLGRSHVRRPEGATACLVLPSYGETR